MEKDIIIQKEKISPIFENVIIQNLKNNTKNQIIQEKNNNIISLPQNKNKIIVVSREDNKKIRSIKKILKKSIFFVKSYDYTLFNFLSNSNFSPDVILKPKDKHIKINNLNNQNIISSNNQPLSYNPILSNKEAKILLAEDSSPLLSSAHVRGEARGFRLDGVGVENKMNKNRLSRYGNGVLKIISKNTQNVIKTNYFGTKNIDNLKIATQKDLKNENSKIIMKPNLKKYLKNISFFNLELQSYQNIIYQFNKKLSKKTSSTVINNNVFTLLEYSFLAMSSLISKPVFVISSNKIFIHLFFYFNKNNYLPYSDQKSEFLSLNKDKLNLLSIHISKLYRKPVVLELNRLYYPFFDSNILSNMIGLISNIIKFRFIIRKLFFIAKLKKLKNLNSLTYSANNRYSLIPSFLSGIKIKLAGRLLTQRVKPRYTVKNIQKGTLARGKANFVNRARFTNKNRRGAFSITVTLGHIFF